jgi:hypothetical protein
MDKALLRDLPLISCFKHSNMKTSTLNKTETAWNSSPIPLLLLLKTFFLHVALKRPASRLLDFRLFVLKNNDKVQKIRKITYVKYFLLQCSYVLYGVDIS